MISHKVIGPVIQWSCVQGNLETITTNADNKNIAVPEQISNPNAGRMLHLEGTVIVIFLLPGILENKWVH